MRVSNRPKSSVSTHEILLTAFGASEYSVESSEQV